ncbi:MAG TPA: hypothetical protein VFU54_15580 [Actinomycetota bacterium]|nr:hypothetical protein [Actinomycetota bacterium]
MDRTAVGSRVGLADRATRILPAAPLHRGPVRFRTLLFRYLAAAFVLLAAVVIANPRPDAAGPAGTPWDYQHEQVDIEGGGVLNAYARVTVGATAWLAKASIERQRDLFRLNLFDFLVGSGTAEAVGRFRAANGPALEAATKAAILGLVLYGVLLRPARRNCAIAVLLLLVATVVVTRPYGTVDAAARPGVQIPNAMLGVVEQAAPGDGVGGAASAVGPAQRRLLTRYWTSFVAHPLSRMQTGTPVLASAPPGKKAGVLAGLRKSVSAVNDWAVGRHGPERAFIATSALGYVLPFAVVLGMLAMVAACAQTMLFVLCLAGLFALPLAVAGRRQRGALIRYWLLPLLAAVAVLALASALSFAVMRTADAVHAADEYVGVLLAGSTLPALAALLMGRRVVRRWRDGRPAPTPIPGS